jgi:hypothetical protein
MHNTTVAGMVSLPSCVTGVAFDLLKSTVEGKAEESCSILAAEKAHFYKLRIS